MSNYWTFIVGPIDVGLHHYWPSLLDTINRVISTFLSVCYSYHSRFCESIIIPYNYGYMNYMIMTALHG